MELGPLISIFLFFVLIFGIIIIYLEEITKMEIFARIQTTPVPTVIAPQPTNPNTTVIPIPSGPPARVFSSNRGVVFGTEKGRITDVKAREKKKIERGEVLHTITNNVTDYYARGFLEEIERLYEPSPHAGKIAFLDRVTGVKESYVEREYVALLTANNIQAQLEITGWKLFDRNRKVSYKLPKAIRVFGSDDIQSATAVRANPGDLIIVSSGSSPSGSSFKLNKCSGYRSQFKGFTPSIKTECPSALDEFLRLGSVPYTDNQCYAVVERLSKCRVVTQIPSSVTKECRGFLETVATEKGCVRQHRNDEGFFLSEWRLFLGSDEEIWKNKDNILYLLDDQNRLVATLVYR